MKTLVALMVLLILQGCSSKKVHKEPPPEKKEVQVTFRSSLDSQVLNGTMTFPPGQPRGAVLMLVGSGKVDRDETTPAAITHSGKIEKLFKQLSDSLVQMGFITLRYDKRGVLDDKGGLDEKVWLTADRDHLISDAVDAAKFLSQQSGIPLNQLSLLGHSEGTIIAVEAAHTIGGEVQRLLLFGAQARSMKDMLHYQIVESRAKQSSGIGKKQAPEKEYRKVLKSIADTKQGLAPDGKPIAWYHQHLAAPSNASRLAKVNAQVFIFQGEADPQTPIDEIDRFKKAGVKKLMVFSYPGLGHGFSPDKEGRPTLGPIDGKVLLDLQKVLADRQPAASQSFAPMTWEEAMKTCRDNNSHVPTAREYIQKLKPLGVQVLEQDQVQGQPPAGYYPVDSINPDGRRDLFYMNHSNYKRPPEVVPPFRKFWTSSTPPSHQEFAHVVYEEWGGGGGEPQEHHKKAKNSFECFRN